MQILPVFHFLFRDRQFLLELPWFMSVTCQLATPGAAADIPRTERVKSQFALHNGVTSI